MKEPIVDNDTITQMVRELKNRKEEKITKLEISYSLFSKLVDIPIPDDGSGIIEKLNSIKLSINHDKEGDWYEFS